ncbi:DUF692 domain-containing protein [Pseudoteredinibacter isoporae]|uniref:DUF692 domain-containing protein n=1 Tax=Pseudoteredinibacter isoporae TaxID=570281 RepID=UPI00310980DD
MSHSQAVEVNAHHKHAESHSLGWVGVGLRHPHYHNAIAETDAVDFLEIHAENFFSEGGILPSILEEISSRYAISLHSTSMGLGSAKGINTDYLERLSRLATRTNPLLISDHASFAWSQYQGKNVHAGDLLPIEFTKIGLEVMTNNVERAQHILGRQILVENLSAYIDLGPGEFQETEFLKELAYRTGCGLLLDLNNLLVNAHNFSEGPALLVCKHWLDQIPTKLVGEIHLAGYTPASDGKLIIDDHSRAVSEECWALYRYAIQRFGPITTLIEWDNDLPQWHELLQEAQFAKRIIAEESTAIAISS